MKIKLPVPTLVDVRYLAVTVPPQDVLEPLNTQRLVFDLDKGGVFVERGLHGRETAEHIRNFDALIGLGPQSAHGVYWLLDAKFTPLHGVAGPLPDFMPHDPLRPGFLRLTVVEGVIMVGDMAWKPDPKKIQAMVDSATPAPTR